MSERRRLSERFLELLAGRVEDARATLKAVGELRRTFDRFDGFGRGWKSNRSTGVNTSQLKLTLVVEFEAASSAARKLGGRELVRLANELDDARTLVLPIVDPPSDAGIREEEARHIWQLLRDLHDAATAALGRKRRVELVVAGVFVLGAVLGFLLGLAANAVFGG